MEYLIGAGIMWVILAILFTWYQDSYNKVAEFLSHFRWQFHWVFLS